MHPPDDLKAWRKAQRLELLQRRQAVTPQQHRQWNERITQLLMAHFPQLAGMTVGIYWPYLGEFDPRFAAHHWRQQGGVSALPEVVEKGAPLQFRRWWPGLPMRAGVFDLPVPVDTPVVVPQALLIPPVGFDAQGYRLGYGGGYFDRTLAALQAQQGAQPLKIGVGFELSELPTIHPQPYDVPMDFIVTEAGVRDMRNATRTGKI